MKLTLIVVPYDSGRFRARMGLGPETLASPELVAELESAGHDVEVVTVRLDDGFQTEVGGSVELMRRVAGAVRRVRAVGGFPIVFSGNCGVGVGTVVGLGSGDSGVLWFDAHGDLNTPSTTPSGFFDGTTFAMLLGHGWESLAATIPGFSPVPVEHAALLAGRALDPPEAALAERIGLTLVRPGEVGSGAARAGLVALGRRVERLYVHLDLDCFDPATLRANHYATDGGPDVGAVLASVTDSATEAPVAALGFASYDPMADARRDGPSVVSAVITGVLAHAGADGGSRS